MLLSRVRSVALSLGIIAVLVAAAFVPGEAAALPLRQRELKPSGAWSWFGDPRAVYHQGAHRRTYVGWVSGAGDIQVGSYDHDTGQRVLTTVRARFQIDDHANPSLLVRPDGHLMVFWSGHLGNAMYYRRSVLPEDISSWEPERTVPTNTSGTWGYTYPNPIQLSAENNRIWLLWRGGNFNPTFSTSTDGLTWAPARTLIGVPDQRPYVKVASNGVDTFHLAFTEGHPRSLRTSIYYARYKAGSFYHANGSLIEPASQLPFSPAQADKVYDQGLGKVLECLIHGLLMPRWMRGEWDRREDAVRWLRLSYRTGCAGRSGRRDRDGLPRQAVAAALCRAVAAWPRGAGLRDACRRAADGWLGGAAVAGRPAADERKGVLPITMAPVLAGLLANDALAVRANRVAPANVLPTRALQVALLVLFGWSYGTARRAQTRG